MQGITVICAKRGGDTQVRDHSEWLLTVPKKPDAVDFSFIPITSLLKGTPGKGFLSHAINLYLRCKFILFSLLLKINENKTITAKHEKYILPCLETSKTHANLSIVIWLVSVQIKLSLKLFEKIYVLFLRLNQTCI